MAQLDYMEKRGSGLTRICNKTKALDGYKDELKPKFKSTPTQFQTIIYASTDTPNVGDHDGDVSETKLTERQQKTSISTKSLQQSPASKCRRYCSRENHVGIRKLYHIILRVVRGHP